MYEDICMVVDIILSLMMEMIIVLGLRISRGVLSSLYIVIINSRDYDLEDLVSRPDGAETI